MDKLPDSRLMPLTAGRAWVLLAVVVLVWSYSTGWDVLAAMLNNSVATKNLTWVSPVPRLMQHALLLPVMIACYAAGFWFARRVRHAAVAVLMHLALAVGYASLVRTSLFVALKLVTGSVNTAGTEYTGIIDATFNPIQYWVLTSLTNLLIYLLGLVIIIGINIHFDLQAERVRISELNAKWLSARLDALRGQLNPHFLFNSLHTISALVLTEPRRADKLLADLSDILRITLRDGRRDFVTVKDEIEYVRRLLAIEETRFEDRLTTHIAVDPSTQGARIPGLILQPLVENAIKYGISNYTGANDVSVAVGREDGALVLSVSNDYRPGDAREPERKMGIGLKNVEERLAAIYGARASMTSGHIPGGRWATRIMIPLENP